MESIFIKTTGCLSLRMDTKRVQDYLSLNGYKIVDDEQKADTVLITGCAVTQDKEKILLDYLSALKGKRVILSGCIAKAAPEKFKNITRIESLDHLDQIFPSNNIELSQVPYSGEIFEQGYLPDYISEKTRNNFSVLEKVISRFDAKTGYNLINGTMGFEFTRNEDPYYKVFVSRGCNFRCNYCIVWKGRGKYKSSALDNVIGQIETGYKQGSRKFLFVADELSGYGTDLPGKPKISDLLNKAFAKFPDIRIALRYLEPMGIDAIWKDVKDMITDERITYLNIPLQTASKGMLKKIKRNTDVDGLKEKIAYLRKKYSMPILTHVIVGFQDETSKDVTETAEYLKDVLFDDVSIHVFSPRPDTPFKHHKIHPDTEDHLEIMNKARRYIRARYMKRLLSGLTQSVGEDSISTKQKEIEFRFPVSVLPDEFLKNLKIYDWSGQHVEVDDVFMHPEINGFVARVRQDQKYHLQFKIKNDERDWDEISIEIDYNEIEPVTEALKEFLSPIVTVKKTRKTARISKDIILCQDNVQGLGDFIEIEGSNSAVYDYMKQHKIDAAKSAEPYGKLIKENLNRT